MQLPQGVLSVVSGARQPMHKRRWRLFDFRPNTFDIPVKWSCSAMSSLNLIHAIDHIQHVLGLLVEFFVLPHFVFEHCRGFCPSPSLGGRHRFLASKWHAKFMDTSWQSSIRKGGQIPRHAWNCSRIFGFRNLSVCVFNFVCFDNSHFCDGRRERPRCCWKPSCLPCWHWTFQSPWPQ